MLPVRCHKEDSQPRVDQAIAGHHDDPGLTSTVVRVDSKYVANNKSSHRDKHKQEWSQDLNGQEQKELLVELIGGPGEFSGIPTELFCNPVDEDVGESFRAEERNQ
jgi:hypothetical protein